jgi:hypothetical protein|tara:strand:+ start:788 stop:1072 length:285 start_codon:yes stop_codon:yes gene_type:complete
MRKIPHPVERKILQPLIDSDHEVMLPLQHIISAWLENKELDSMLALIKDWINGLQEMYDKAERVDDLENNLYHIDNLVDDAENTLSEIRGYTNV